MDNIIQNIPIENIIPIQIPEDEKSLKELIESIKKYGIVEPLLVRQKDDKFEIIAGRKRYLAAKKLGIKAVPALIRNIDINFFTSSNKPKEEKKSQNKFININPHKNENLPKQKEENITDNGFREITQKYNDKNSDIINLSELNKEENERDEFYMNNQMPNNQGVQPQNIGAPQGQAPTFGGRFFPSLEDEPTNMNVEGMNIIGAAMQNSTPIENNNVPNNNLIDLTEENIEKINPIPSPEEPTMINPLEQTNMQQNFGQAETFEMPTNNSFEQPVNNMESNNFESIQTQFNQAPNNQPTQEPQFDMSQSMMTPNNMDNMNMPNNFNTQPNIDVQMPINNDYQEQNIQMQGQQDFQTPNEFTQPIQQQEMPVQQPEYIQPMPQLESIPNEQQLPQKDVGPVVNTITNLANSLAAFGYNINVSTEDLGTSTKIIIEVQK